MTASEVAQLLHARRVRRGQWEAKCPSHPDRHPSLGIREGHSAVLLKCWSQGCEVKAICAAIGIRQSDLFYNAEIRAETRQRLADEKRLVLMERKFGLVLVLESLEKDRRNYWMAAERGIGAEMQRLRARIDRDKEAARRRAEEFQRQVKKHGWNYIWDRFLASDAGKAIEREYGLPSKAA